MSNIKHAFEHGKAFIAYVTCGDPDLDTTQKVIEEIAKGGADLIELGIPFSDPTAEGPTIHSASVRALANGATTDKIFKMVEDVRKEVKTPMVFMTYANVVYSYGMDRFCAKTKELGIDGLILPDVPYEEKEEFAPTCRKYGLDLVSLIAPTSEDRIQEIAKNAEGFIYVVSSLGVTGVRSNITTDLGAIMAHVRQANPDIPAAIGFGISTPEQAHDMAQYADGVIVGSAIVKMVAEGGKSALPLIRDYVHSMKMGANS